MSGQVGLHQVLIPRDDERDGWPQWRCPHPKDSTTCGLMIENRSHEPDACAAYDEGDDGCDENYPPGWVKATGCAVGEVAGERGLTADECGLGDDVPRNQWLPVEITWDDFGEDASPTASPSLGVQS